MEKRDANGQEYMETLAGKPDPSKSSSTSPPIELLMSEIDSDSSLQVRLKLDDKTVKEYAEAINNGTIFPPIEVFRTDSKIIIVNGWHRYEAYKLCKKEKIYAFVFNGDLRDAKLHAIKADTNVGLRRTREDKRQAVEWLLADSEWVRWSSGTIAKCTGVSDRFVDKVRKELEADGKIVVVETRKTKRNGKDVTIKKKEARQVSNVTTREKVETPTFPKTSMLLAAVEKIVTILQDKSNLNDEELIALCSLVKTIEVRTARVGGVI